MASTFRSRLSKPQSAVLVAIFVIVCLCAYRLLQTFDIRPVNADNTAQSGNGLARTAGDDFSVEGVPVDISLRDNESKEAILKKLGVFFSRSDAHWLRKSCEPKKKLRPVSIMTGIGNLTFYIYDNGYVDTSVSERALHGEMFERYEIERFLLISKDLPLIDVGANVGLVTLQAAIQGRQVIAVEPIQENALRLCRSAVDFGHSSLVHVVNNAASSSEGSMTLAMDIPRHVAHFEIQRNKGWGFGATTSYSILIDRLLEIMPFKRAALKIDVETHEGHVMAGAARLFQEVDIPLVWMEWEFVKKIPGTYGPQPIIQFMREHKMEPHDLMTGRSLSGDDFMAWPFTVLWVKAGVRIAS